ncbi:LysR family transcriptional regulator [Kroppenstedtia pulmonis]|uniref:LysR family transcriptional regulator n=1 Tax=Kroppenstedtia pulmonis TaxID=1380685 RepID=A0A7D4C633_9BACL|nr:LysR family transcriptional regulator [Kroppenstedtia pulmonis]QKG84176.1 LysR family transcriptional regulator [Kroppenstedtia pulmonis]
MEIKQLITFKTAAENLNFTQTAKTLNFAQSTVTAQIKALETELGTLLFERLGRRLILTEAGHQFKIYADQMIMLSKEAKTAVNKNEATTGTLIIGAQESQCTYRLPRILREFKAQFPSVKLIFKPSHSDEIAREHLMNGLLDIAFITDICRPGGTLKIESLIHEPLKMIASPDHPLLERREVYPEDLIHETLLLTETGCSYRRLLEETFRSAEVYPLYKFEFISIEAIKQCVMAGLGIAILPAIAVEAEIETGMLKELAWRKSSVPPIFTQIAWHRDKWMTPPMGAFIELTQTMFLDGQGNRKNL